MPAKSKINLLPKDEFEDSSLGKFFKWAVSVGRWIVVFTEFIVICAFLSRFYFDTKLANLFDDLKQKQAIVDSALSFEDNFRELQDKTKTIKTILAQEKHPAGYFTDINKFLPLNVFLSEIGFDENQINLTGYALSESGLNAFLQNLVAYPATEKITLSNVSNKKGAFSGIDFNINAVLKGK